MKKYIFMLLMILSISSCSSHYNLKPEKFTLSASGKRITVLPFSDVRPKEMKEDYDSPVTILQKKLITGLNRKGFLVVERENLDKILKEQEFQLTGLVDAKDAVQIGKLSGAELIMTGSITEYQRTIYPKAKLKMTIKVISVETGLVVSSQDISASKSNWFYPIELLDDIVEDAADEIINSIQ
ncbi:MAG: CsgG/HfaB family protein [Spirochaetes bacterium]|nr:CsgG/HfaB family protein [Spirochaetota bacterium]